MRGSNLFKEVLPGELSVSASVPIRAGVVDVGHIASKFWEIALIWPVGILLKGTGGGKGANLTLSLAGSEMKIAWMLGFVGGQRIRFP